MLTIGNRSFPSTFIKRLKLKDKSIVVSFYINGDVRINFTSRKDAMIEYEKATEQLENTKERF